MGLFHDKCQAIVDIATGEALRGDELAEAKALYESNSNAFGNRDRVLAERGWRVCGNAVSKRARVCNKCGSRAPGSWLKCPACNNWVGVESRFCSHCNHPLHPEEHIDFAGGIWDRRPSEFASRFEVHEAAKVMNNGIHVQEGTVAVLLDSGKVSDYLKAGRHNPNSLGHKVNWFGNPPPRSVLMVDGGDVVFKLDFENLKTAEEYPIRMIAEVTVRFDPSRADDFISNVLKGARDFSYEQVVAWLTGECRYAAGNLCVKTTVEDLVKDPNRRTVFEDELSRTLKDLCKRSGFEFIRVGTVDFMSPEYENLRRQVGELDYERRQFELKQKLMEHLATSESTEISDEQARLVRKNSDAEFKARTFKNHENFLLQLAQEKEIDAITLAKELEIFKKVSEGDLSAKDAELEIARLQEAHAKKMLLVAQEYEATDATLKNKLSLDRTVKDYDREEQLRKAHHGVQLKDIERGEALKDAKNVAEVKTVERTTKIEDAKAEDTINVGHTDAAVYDADKWLDIRAKKNDIQFTDDARRAQLDLDAEERRLRLQMEIENNRAKNVKGMSALEMAGFTLDAGARAEFMKLAVELARKEMTPEQIMASLSGNSSTAADALKALYTSKDSAAREIIAELKKMEADTLARSDKMMERQMQMFEKLAAFQAETATTAAKRVDNTAQVHMTPTVMK